jgi:hypothetical protein
MLLTMPRNRLIGGLSLMGAVQSADCLWINA